MKSLNHAVAIDEASLFVLRIQLAATTAQRSSQVIRSTGGMEEKDRLEAVMPTLNLDVFSPAVQAWLTGGLYLNG